MHDHAVTCRVRKPRKKSGPRKRNRKSSRRTNSPRSGGKRRWFPSGMDVGVHLPMDYPWKVLDRLTNDLTEYVCDSDISLIRGIVRSRDIEKYLELQERWGLQSINLTGKSYSPEMACKLLLSAVIRKYPFEGREKERSQVAITNVIETNKSCSRFNRRGWKCLFLDGQPTLELSLMREFIEKVVDPLLPDGSALTDRSRHGPGSDTGTVHGANSTYAKYAKWPYHCTAQCLEHARGLIRDDERWLGALEDSYRRRFQINFWEILDQETFWGSVISVTDHNKVTTVPKDYRKDRPIAIEPRLNLMLQLGVDGFIRRRLKRWGIDLDSQVKNQEMARDGSIRKDADTPVTIDLSNASDTISLRLVKLLFPQSWYRYLCELRTPQGVLPGGAKLRYSKLSSMGNGFTFAVESLVFSAACYAVMKRVYGKWDSSMVSVFGDDIIVPQACAHPLTSLLAQMGFTINTDKSFLVGTVRESCGTDWVAGVNVRPVFLKEIPKEVDVLFAHRNLLRRWAHLFLGKDLEETMSLIEHWIPPRLAVKGPVSDEEFSSYLHDPVAGQFSNWSFFHQYIACRPRAQDGNDFLFRKLMHDLRAPAGTEPENAWRAPRSLSERMSGGSRFTVTIRNRVAYSMRVRRVPYWNAEYSMPTTAKVTS